MVQTSSELVAESYRERNQKLRSSLRKLKKSALLGGAAAAGAAAGAAWQASRSKDELTTGHGDVPPLGNHV